MRVYPILLILLILSNASAQEAGVKIPATSQETREFTYKQIPQGELKLLVDVPADWKASDKRPAIVFYFGGGWNGGTTKQFEDQARYLASRGMVAARADYRVKSRQGVTPDKCVEDAKSALRWMRQHAAELGIDPDRIAAGGGSAGWHLAACTSLTTGLEAEGEQTVVSSRPAALVLFNPVLKFAGVESLEGRLGGNKDLAAQISPTLHLKQSTPPTIMFFGTEDKLIEQAHEFLARSKELGHRAEMMTAEGVGHSFFNRSPWKERTLRRADEFLTSIGYLQGPATFEAP